MECGCADLVLDEIELFGTHACRLRISIPSHTNAAARRHKARDVSTACYYRHHLCYAIGVHILLGHIALPES